MEIVETSIFTREIVRVLNDEEYKKLQIFLVAHPRSGDIIKGSGGMRKLRWKVGGQGKSGGIRTIYYYQPTENIILMIFVYKKSEAENLTPRQIELLKKAFLEGV